MDREAARANGGARDRSQGGLAAASAAAPPLGRQALAGERYLVLALLSALRQTNARVGGRGALLCSATGERLEALCAAEAAEAAATAESEAARGEAASG